jgi:hypothetical protein
MFTSLISNVNTVLNSVTELAFVYNHQLKEDQVDGFPCAIFYPVAFDGHYLSNQENLEGYKFKIFIIAEANVKTLQAAVNTILAPAVDAVIEQFRADWNQGVTSEGHRIWWNLETGAWQTSIEADGAVAFTEFDLTINLLSDV